MNDRIQTYNECGPVGNVFVERIVELLKPYYRPGERQDIILGLAGACKKAGIEYEKVLE